MCVFLVLCDAYGFLLYVFQATIGIDFLSKTMYLEDRTVCASLFNCRLSRYVVISTTMAAATVVTNSHFQLPVGSQLACVFTQYLFIGLGPPTDWKSC